MENLAPMQDMQVRTLALQTLEESFQIQAHLEYAQYLLERYNWDNHQSEKIKNLLKEVSDRKNDTNLYLGIIGEFSSGKSTLINALLRDEILKSDVLQATTSSITMLKYGENLSIEVKFLTGDTFQFPRDEEILGFLGVNKDRSQRENAQELLLKVTAVEGIAKLVERVIIQHPAKILKQGLVIIDTPGTNADVPRHAEITNWAIKELCDTAIILIPANIPFSDTFSYFLQNQLKEVIHRCIFSVTKVDIVRRYRDREMLMATIIARIRSVFSIDSPKVLPVTTIFRIKEINPKESFDHLRLPEEEQEILRHSFDSFETEVLQSLKEQRFLILMERLTILLSFLWKEIETDLSQLKGEYESQHKALLANQIPNLQEFIQNEKIGTCNEFKRNLDHLYQDINEMLFNEERLLNNEITAKINSANSNEVLKNICENQLDKIIDRSQQRMETAFKKVHDQTGILQSSVIDKFIVRFLKIYQQLATLGGRIHDENASNLIQSSSMIQMKNINLSTSEINHFLNEKKSEGNTFIGGGMVAGLIISFAIPVIGPLLGIFLGGMLGSLFGPSLDTLKTEAKDKMKNQLSTSFTNLRINAKISIDKLISECCNNINNRIDLYFDYYRQLAKEMQDRDNHLALNLREKQQTIQADLYRLRKEYEQLESGRAELKKLKLI